MDSFRIFLKTALRTCFFNAPKNAFLKKSNFDIWAGVEFNHSRMVAYDRISHKTLFFMQNTVKWLSYEQICIILRVCKISPLYLLMERRNILAYLDLIWGRFYTSHGYMAQVLWFRGPELSNKVSAILDPKNTNIFCIE